jgi:hypothetical protein
MKLAPIVLFVYNRPGHTQRLLDSLAANTESKDSLLYIYCDGAKNNANEDEVRKIEKTREIIDAETRFKDVIITIQSKNKGLANSIIDGVTEIINRYGKVIVLEDDLIVSPFFLAFMNDALERYADTPHVGQIGACNMFACGSKYPSSFFTIPPDCWGWATWKDRWAHFNPDGKQLLEQLESGNLMNKFNVYGSYRMKELLIAQINGLVSSWAVRWTAVCVLNNWLTLYPNPSITNHIESANATHAQINVTPPLMLAGPVFKTVDVIELPKIRRAMMRGYKGIGDYYGNIKMEYKIKIIKELILPPRLRNALGRLINAKKAPDNGSI